MAAFLSVMTVAYGKRQFNIEDIQQVFAEEGTAYLRVDEGRSVLYAVEHHIEDIEAALARAAGASGVFLPTPSMEPDGLLHYRSPDSRFIPLCDAGREACTFTDNEGIVSCEECRRKMPEERRGQNQKTGRPAPPRWIWEYFVGRHERKVSDAPSVHGQ